MDKRKIKYFTIMDYNEEERWLENQHRQGWKLVKTVAGCLFIFEQCVPEEVHYKLEYTNQKASGDYVQLYKDYGWNYVTSCLGWNYFRKEEVNAMDKNEKEIFSDNISKLNMIYRIYKTRILPFLLLIPSTFILNFLIFIHREATLSNLIVMTIYFIVAVLDIYLLIYCSIKLIKLRRKLENEEI